MKRKKILSDIFFLAFTLTLVTLMISFIWDYASAVESLYFQTYVFIMLVLVTALFSLLVTIFNIVKFIKRFGYLTYIASTILLLITGYIILNLLYNVTSLQNLNTFALLSLTIIKILYNFYLFYTNFDFKK